MDKVRIGQITAPHGVHGEVKILPMTDDPHRFSKLTCLELDCRGRLMKRDIESVRFHKKHVLVRLTGINSANDAEGLRGAYCVIDKKDRLPLPDDRFYIDDLVGLFVYENDVCLGQITDVLQPGANDVYVVTQESGQTIYVPALKSVVLKVTIEDARMDVVLPKGLLS